MKKTKAQLTVQIGILKRAVCNLLLPNDGYSETKRKLSDIETHLKEFELGIEKLKKLSELRPNSGNENG